MAILEISANPLRDLEIFEGGALGPRNEQVVKNCSGLAAVQ